jgi:ABC-2 type transport system permease protein
MPRFHPIPVRLRAQIRKELLCLLRDPRSRLVLVVPPLVQLLLFSVAITLEVRNVDIAVLNRDEGHWSHELEARIAASSFVGQIRMVQSPTQRDDLITRRQAIAAVEIPADFSRRITTGDPAVVQVIVDGRRANAGQVTVGYLDNIVRSLGAEIRQDASPAAGPTVRHLFNPNLEYRWFVVPGLAGILTTFTALIVTALSIARERELGTFDQLVVSPSTPGEIILAKSAPALLVGTVLGLVMVTAGVFVFGIPFTGSFLLLLACLLVYIGAVTGIGLCISAICTTQQQAILGAFATGVPMVLMSGFATPVDNMPPILQWLSQAIPLTHLLPILHGSFLKALPVTEILRHLWPIALIAGVTLSTAVWVVRRQVR